MANERGHQLDLPATKPKIPNFEDVPAVLQSNESVGTNRKRRKLLLNEDVQPQLTRTRNTVKED